MARPNSTESPATRMLFVSSNGVGMGHLTRLLAVARRLPENHETIFLTMSQALSIIDQFGFHAEYLPSHQQTLSDIEDWNNWLAIELTEILDRFSIGGVVFDGNLVFPGLADAVSARARSPLIWIRRGMWRADQDNSPSLLSGEAADLVIEPDDIASDLDTGVTAELRDEVQIVDPIRLLDDDEVLSRDESCHKLGLDPNRLYALIQLGSGNNANVLDLIGSVIAALHGSEVQPVIAEWLTAELRYDLWPRVPRLSCYPISRYYRAFDFTVSAAGYNSFNELIGFGVPSILVPNLNRSMDDQRARAEFASRHGAALHLELDDFSNLDSVLEEIMDSDRRQTMRGQCRLIAKPNGAQEAARAIASRVTGEGGR